MTTFSNSAVIRYSPYNVSLVYVKCWVWTFRYRKFSPTPCSAISHKSLPIHQRLRSRPSRLPIAASRYRSRFLSSGYGSLSSSNQQPVEPITCPPRYALLDGSIGKLSSPRLTGSSPVTKACAPALPQSTGSPPSRLTQPQLASAYPVSICAH